jgi:pimeloyl-ACP methyl ester carboxylesterase
MQEELVLFGDRGDLVGIRSTPAQAQPATLACLFPNVGLAHRIGPHRLNVRLARHLAQEGITSLRFDLSGMGDSQASRSSAHFMEQAVRDMKAAMDHMERAYGIRRFLVFGICSGAVNGYMISLADDRVVGVLMYDGFRYPSWMARLSNGWQLTRSLTFRSAMGKVVRRLRRGLDKSEGPSDVTLIDVGVDEVAPSASDFAQAMDQLVARGVSVYFIFSGGTRVKDSGLAELSQFKRDSFVRHVRYEFMPDLDHTATPVAAQQKLMGVVASWARSVQVA